jgi:hypothetical protein
MFGFAQQSLCAMVEHNGAFFGASFDSLLFLLFLVKEDFKGPQSAEYHLAPTILVNQYTKKFSETPQHQNNIGI